MINEKNLLQFLEPYLTDNRKQLFEKILQKRTRHLTIALEDIYQPQNASAVLRSCECFGVQDVHIIENDHAYKVNKNVVNGADKWLDIHYYNHAENNTEECIKALTAKGYRIIAATPHSEDCLLEDFDISEKSAVFFGTEGQGLSQQVIKHADGFLKIPIYGFTESFNISVAVAVSVHFLTHKLRNSNVAWKLSEDEIMEKKLEWTIKSLRKGEQLVKYFRSHEIKPSK